MNLSDAFQGLTLSVSDHVPPNTLLALGGGIIAGQSAVCAAAIEAEKVQARMTLTASSTNNLALLFGAPAKGYTVPTITRPIRRAAQRRQAKIERLLS